MSRGTKWPSRNSVVGIISLGTGRLFFWPVEVDETPTAGILDSGEILLAIQQAYAMIDHTITKMKRKLGNCDKLERTTWQMVNVEVIAF